MALLMATTISLYFSVDARAQGLMVGRFSTATAMNGTLNEIFAKQAERQRDHNTELKKPLSNALQQLEYGESALDPA